MTKVKSFTGDYFSEIEEDINEWVVNYKVEIISLASIHTKTSLEAIEVLVAYKY